MPVTQIPQGKVKYLVVARNLRHVGEVHDIYENWEEAKSALARYFEAGASSSEMYNCTFIPEPE